MSADIPQPGEVLLGKLRVERVLGQGGMGVVLEATHLHLDKRVAVKLMLPETLANVDAVGRFLREARAAARIAGEHVARVLDVSQLEDGTPILVMEFLEGADLSSVLKSRGPLPLEDAVEYVLQACEAIAEAHAKGVIHRDLKPENLFLTRGTDGLPLVKVLDFGISKIAPRDGQRPEVRTLTGALMGTPVYMSPEQLRASRAVDARSDVWSLGVVLFELVSARLPFDAETVPQTCALILSEPAPSVRAFRPDLPAAFEWVLERCFEKVPAERFATIAELAFALAPFGPARSRLSVERIVSIHELSGGVRAPALPPEGPPPPTPSPVERSAAPRPKDTFDGNQRVAPHRKSVTVAGVAIGAIAALVLAGALRVTTGRLPAAVAPAPSAEGSASPNRDPNPAAPGDAATATGPEPAPPPTTNTSAETAASSTSAPTPATRSSAGRRTHGAPRPSPPAKDTSAFGETVN